MEELSDKNRVLGERIDSSMAMTQDIDSQVENVAGLVQNIVEISEKSGEHAKLVRDLPWLQMKSEN